MSTPRRSCSIGPRRCLRGTLLAMLCAVAVLGPSTFTSAQEKVVAHGALEFGEVERLRLEAGTVHEWTLDLQESEYVEIVVDQIEFDVAIEWIDAAGELVTRVDGPEPRGPEKVELATQATGEWTLRVRSLGGESGDFEVRWVARREATSVEVAMTINILAVRHYDEGRYSESEPLFEEALGIRRRVLGPEHPDTLDSINDVANLYRRQGRYEEAEPLYDKALDVRRRVLGPEHPDTLISMNNLGILYRSQGRYEEAEPLYEETLEARRRVLGPEHPNTLNSINNLAILYKSQGRYGEAEPLYDETLEASRRVLGSDNPNTLLSMNNLAEMYRAQGRHAEAEPLYKGALDASRSVLASQHPYTLAFTNNLAILHMAQGRYADAEPLSEEAVEVSRRVLGPEHPFTLNTMNNLGELYRKQGRTSEAEQLKAKILEVTRRLMGPEHPDTLVSMNNLAILYQTQGRYGEAVPLYQAALEASRRVLGPEHPSTLALMRNLASLYKLLGRDGEAEPLYEETLAASRRVLGPGHVDTLGSVNNLALYYESQERRAEAMALVEAAIEIADPVQHPGLLATLLNTRASFHRDAEAFAEAIDDLAEALRTIEDLRPQVGGGETTRAGWFSEYRGWYDDMVALQLEVGSTEAAIEYVERGRARTLLDQLAAGKVQLRDSIEPDLRTRLEARKSEALARQAEYQQRTTLARSNTSMTEQKRTANVERLQGLLREADLEVARVNAAIKNASPLWRDTLTSGGRTIGVRDIQRFVLADGGVMLMYQIGEDNSYVLVVPQRGKAAAYELTVSDEAASVLDIESGALSEAALNDLIGGSADGESPAGIVSLLSGQSRSLSLRTGSGVQDTARLASVLQVLLPEEIRDEVMSAKEVVVVPDGVLHQIAFEALVIDTAEKPVYWLDGGPPVRYTASATVLYNIERRPSRSVLAGDDGAPTLTVADPVFDVQELIAAAEAAAAAGTDATRTSGGLPDLAELTRRSYERAGGVLARLPGTRRESEALARVFGSNRVESITGAQATEARVRERLPAKRYLHFGTHGLVDERRNSMFSALALTPPAEETASADNDGYLQLHEIYGLPLENAELAVLSACETNVGEQVDGEGVFALSRGFLAAGAQRVVASQWAVNDESTAVLIGAFFEKVREQEEEARGVDYAAALRDAKLTVRNHPAHPEWAAPYYWAPFILTGKR